MWNSPGRKSKAGKRYDVRDITALISPLDQLLDFFDSSPVKDLVGEKILQRMEKEELIFGIYQVLQALLEDIPVPRKGHAGFHEAIVAELLNQTHGQIACELDDSESGDYARKSAWESIRRLSMRKNPKGKLELWQLKGLGLNLESPRVHRSKKITSELWADLLSGEGGLWSEFLWDDDWRMDSLMDLPEPAAKKVTDILGLDLEVVHGLPHMPTRAELTMAEYYIRYVIWKDEATRT
jgi:hypothetical protein